MPEYLAPGVYEEDVGFRAKAIEGVGTSTTGFIGTAEKGENDKPALITSWKEFTDSFGRYIASAPYLAPAVNGFFVNGGKRCFIVKVKDGATDSDYIGTGTIPGKKTGLQALDDIDEISIVCIPGITSIAVQNALLNHCETRRYRFCIFDSQKNANIDAIKRQRSGIVSNRGYGAMYYPWVKAEIETANDVVIQELIPPSGHIAGIYAQSDIERGVHKAPANKVIMGAVDLEANITKKDQDIVNPLGINCIRASSGRGIRVWGARTCSLDPEWQYVNVRRLFIYLEKSIDKGTQWAVFDPNNERLWENVRRTITDFLICVWRDGALMGSTPNEAFFVRCDRTTMTQDDIDNGRLIAMIGVAPTKPAEFVIFRIQQLTADSR
jgi:phage tail sheath protein FI